MVWLGVLYSFPLSLEDNGSAAVSPKEDDRHVQLTITQLNPT